MAGSCTAHALVVSSVSPARHSQSASGNPQDLAAQLTEITGFDKVSLQPNAGASGEYAGLMAIRAYHQSRGDSHRNVRMHPQQRSLDYTLPPALL